MTERVGRINILFALSSIGRGKIEGMTRQQALTIAAQVIGNMFLVRKKRDYREYQNELNYLADCLMEAADGQVDMKRYIRA